MIFAYWTNTPISEYAAHENDEGEVVQVEGYHLPTADEIHANNANFLGWFTEENGGGTQVTDSSTFSSSTTLYANWEELSQTFTITLDPNGGELPSEGNILEVVEGNAIGEVIEGPSYIVWSEIPWMVYSRFWW